MKEYTYAGPARLRVLTIQLVGAAGIILSTIMAIVILLGSLWRISANGADVSGMICIAGSALIIGWIGGFVAMNLYPTIWAGDEGLVLSYFVFWRVRVPWDEIVDMKPIPFRSRDVLVRARRVTPFHRLFGLRYWLSLMPSFVIARDIEDRDELIREITKRIHVRHVR